MRDYNQYLRRQAKRRPDNIHLAKEIIMTLRTRFTTALLLIALSWHCGAADTMPSKTPTSRAIETLSHLLSVPSNEIQWRESESLDWMDSSLGCPQPGRFYAQMITPGYRVRLTHQQRDYSVHLTTTQGFVCLSLSRDMPEESPKSVVPEGIHPTPFEE